MDRFRIVEGGVYLYTADAPKGCKGHRYRVLRFIVAAPSYQQQVLVEALSGPHAGLWFSTTPWNFSTRYALAPVEQPVAPPAVPVPEKVAGYTTQGSGA